MELPIEDRVAAGRALASALNGYRQRDNLLILALPRGGVPVAYGIARELNADLDLLLVRKLGVPGHEEVAMGAIASGDIRVLNEGLIRSLGIGKATVEAVATAQEHELERRQRTYRGNRPMPSIRDRCIILVDDGVATGATMRAAIAALRRLQPARLVVAVPVAPPDTIEQLQQEADEVVCLQAPRDFGGVSLWYRDFSQLTDDDVRAILARAWTS